MIGALTLNYNDADTTIRFVERIKQFNCIDRIIIVDNHSTDDSRMKLSEYEKENEKIELLLNHHNGGYGAGNNFGIRYINAEYHYEYILLANPDTSIKEEVLLELKNFLAENPDYAIVAPVMCNEKGERQYNAAFRIPSKWEYILSLSTVCSRWITPLYYKDIKSKGNVSKQVGNVSGSLFLMRTQDMIQYGMYDENIFLYCEEMVLGLKMEKAGRKIALLQGHTFIHQHSVSISKTYHSEISKKRLLLNSKLYVIKHYFEAKPLEIRIAQVLSKVALLETKLSVKLKGE